ncbi:MAG: GspH/FimT family pseudopilin [Gammaproteobacteria bacterium]
MELKLVYCQNGGLAYAPRLGGAGFTVIEVLVVLVITGLIAGLTILSIHPASTVAEEEARTLESVLKLGLEEAVLAGRMVGVMITRQGYSLHWLEQRGGRPRLGLGIYAPRKFPARLDIELTIEQLAVARRLGDSAIQPRIWLFPTGETTPFTITVKDARSRSEWQLTGSENGTIELKGLHNENP